MDAMEKDRAREKLDAMREEMDRKRRDAGAKDASSLEKLRAELSAMRAAAHRKELEETFFKLDMALGVGPLKATQVQKIKFENSNIVDVRHSDVTQHALMIMNANKKGTDDIKVRQAIIHAIDKARFIEGEFAGLESFIFHTCKSE